MTEKQKELLKAIREQPNPEEVLDILIAIVERKLQKKLGEEQASSIRAVNRRGFFFFYFIKNNLDFFVYFVRVVSAKHFQ